MKVRYVNELDWSEKELHVADVRRFEGRVFNAPRPLSGARTWQGEFRCGVFYAVVWPDTYRAGDLIEQNARLDAVELCFVGNDELAAMIVSRLEEQGYSLADYEAAGLGIEDAAQAVGLPAPHMEAT